MSITPSPAPTPAPDHGLPPVVPPSGRQILQLFVVPALIVALLVGLFLLGPPLKRWFGRPADTRSAEEFLTQLDNPNAEVRYRAASDLAQVLLRKEELACDVEFGLGLVERLSTALEASAEAEKSYASRVEGLSVGDRAKELKKLEADRNFITYLAASLGHMMVPVGVPLLGKMATQTDGMEPEALAERRSRALFALATLGDKLGRYDKLDNETKDEIESKLEASKGGTARAALDHLRARRAGSPNAMGVASILAKTAADEDMYLRQLSAFASNYWMGNASEEKVIEEFLVALSNDTGIGADRLEERLSRNPDSNRSQSVTKKKGFEVQVNATISLTRRGSSRVRIDLLEEMLDLDGLREVFVIRTGAGSETPNDALAVETVLNALRALAKFGEKRAGAKLSDRVTSSIETLEKSDNPAIAAQAKQTRLALAKS